MNRITIETLHDDPRFSRKLHLAAQRERAIAIGAGFARLRDHLAQRLRRRPDSWLSRLG